MMKLKLISFLFLIIFTKTSFAGNHSNDADFSKEFETAVIHVQEKKYLEAVKGFTALANQGLPEAQFNLSLLFFSGLGVPKNFKDALYWSWYAHLNEHEAAINQVNKTYDYITENLRNEVANKIIEELLATANSGDHMSALKLGQTYTGLLVTPDYQSAYVWLSIAQAYGIETASELLEEAAKQLTLEDILAQQNEASSKFSQINP